MESVGPRQKRRRVEAALKDIELSIEAESSFTGVRTEEYDLLPETTVNEEIADEPTDGDTQEDLITNQLVTDGAGAFQCRMDFSETLTVIDEFDYESDAEPLDSSFDECEISSDDDFDDDSNFKICLMTIYKVMIVILVLVIRFHTHLKLNLRLGLLILK